MKILDRDMTSTEKLITPDVNQPQPIVPGSQGPEINPGWWETWAAGLQRESSASAMYRQWATRGYDLGETWDAMMGNVPEDEDFDPIPLVPDHLIHRLHEFVGIRSKREFDIKLSLIDQEKQLDRIIQAGSGWAAFWGTAVGYIGSPELIPFLAAGPIGTGAKSAIGVAGRLGAFGATEAAVHEGLMQQMTYERSKYESFANVAMGGLFGAGIGYGAGRLMRAGIAKELDEITQEIGGDLRGFIAVDENWPNPPKIGPREPSAPVQQATPAVTPDEAPAPTQTPVARMEVEKPKPPQIKLTDSDRASQKSGVWETKREPFQDGAKIQSGGGKSYVDVMWTNKEATKQSVFRIFEDGTTVTKETIGGSRVKLPKWIKDDVVGQLQAAKQAQEKPFPDMPLGEAKVKRDPKDVFDVDGTYTVTYPDGSVDKIFRENVNPIGGSYPWYRVGDTKYPLGYTKKEAMETLNARYAEKAEAYNRQNARRFEGEPDEPLPEQAAAAAESTVGAAARTRGMQEGPISQALIKSGNLSILRPMLAARVAKAHQVLNEFFGHDGIIGANMRKVLGADGKERLAPVAKQTALARKVEREIGVYMRRNNKILADSYLEYIGQPKGSYGKAMLSPSTRKLWKEFSEQVRYAMSTGDQHTNEIVQKTAQQIRKDIYQPILDLAIENRMFGEKAVKKTRLAKQRQQVLDKEGNPVRDEKGFIKYEIVEKEVTEVQYEPIRPGKEDEVLFAETYMNRRYNKLAVQKGKDAFVELFIEGSRKHLATLRAKAKEGDLLARYELLHRRIGQRQSEALREKTRLVQKNAKLEQEIKGLKNKGAIKTRRQEIALNKAKITNRAKIVDGTDNKTISQRQEMDDIKRMAEDLSPEDFQEIDDLEVLDMRSAALDTYEKIVYGEINGDVFASRPGAGRPFRQRKVPIEDSVLLEHGFLETDMFDQTRAYINTMLRPTRMMEAAGDTEMRGVLNEVKDAYRVMQEDVGRRGETKLRQELEQEESKVIQAFQKARDRYYGRRAVPSDHWVEQAANVSKFVRNWNVTRMMGGVLFTSIGDLARLNIATAMAPELGGFAPGWVAAVKTMSRNKDAMQTAGIAHETATMMRTSKMVDSVDMVAGKPSVALDASARFTQGFMRFTGLADWTDYMKLLAASFTQNDIIWKITQYDKLADRSKIILAEMGIDETLARQIADEFGKHGEMMDNGATSLNWDAWDNRAVADQMKDILFRQSERILVSPRETDLPAWADNEAGRNILQFRSFSLAAHNQVTMPMIERAKIKDPTVLKFVAQGVTLGLMTEIIKLATQGRLEQTEDYTGQDWALAALDRSGMIPALMMGFNGVDLLSRNKLTELMNAQPVSRYSDRSVVGLLGPTTGTFMDTFRLVSGGFDGIDERDARTVRRLLPLNNVAYWHWLITKMEGGAAPRSRYRSKEEEGVIPE